MRFSKMLIASVASLVALNSQFELLGIILLLFQRDTQDGEKVRISR